MKTPPSFCLSICAVLHWFVFYLIFLVGYFPNFSIWTNTGVDLMYIFPLLLTSRIPVYHSLLFLYHKCNCYVLYPHHSFVPVWGTVGRFCPIWGDLNFVFNMDAFTSPQPLHVLFRISSMAHPSSSIRWSFCSPSLKARGCSRAKRCIHVKRLDTLRHSWTIDICKRFDWERWVTGPDPLFLFPSAHLLTFSDPLLEFSGRFKRMT